MYQTYFLFGVHTNFREYEETISYIREEVQQVPPIVYPQNSKPVGIIKSQAKKAARALAEHALNHGDPTDWPTYNNLELQQHPAVIVCYCAYRVAYICEQPFRDLRARDFCVQVKAEYLKLHRINRKHSVQAAIEV